MRTRRLSDAQWNARFEANHGTAAREYYQPSPRQVGSSLRFFDTEVSAIARDRGNTSRHSRCE